MDRRASIWHSAASSLILIFSSYALGQEFNVGEITQLQGEITALEFVTPHRKLNLSKKSPLKEECSILSGEDSFYTAKLLDGSWIRVSPKTKLSFDYDPNEKTIKINLYLGSIKILFSTNLNQRKIEKIIVYTAGLKLESADGKFSIMRNILTNESSIFVEKGLVMASLENNLNQQIYLHAREKLIMPDRQKQLPEIETIKDKEMKAIHSKFYLKIK
jgi:hypothetical protein